MLRRYGRDGFVRHLAWLTYFGPSESAGLDLAAAANLSGLECSDVAGGHLLRLGPAPSARTYGPYLRLLEATEAALGKDRVAELSDLDRRTRAEYPPAVAALPEPESVPKPLASKDRWGREVIQGGRYQRMRFAGIRYGTAGGILEGFDVEKCEFDNVSIGVSVVKPGMAAAVRRFNPDVSHEYDSAPVVVRNCTLTRCRIWQAYLRYVLVEDSVVDGLSGSLSMTSEVLLRHVVIRGPIDSIDIRHPRQVMGPEPLIALHDAHYETVDWALDISEARFARCSIAGVPGRLVRRDPATQILVTRERVLAAPWREVSHGSVWEIGIDRMLKTGADSEVFVACPRGNDFDETLAVFRRLREAGIAEPD